MNRLSYILSALLCGSVGLNVYLLEHQTPTPVSHSQGAGEPFNTYKEPPPNTAAERPLTDGATTNDSLSKSSQNKKQKALQLFKLGRYDEALELYDQLTLEDGSAARALHQLWHDTLQKQLQAKELLQLEPFLTAFLQYAPYDKAFLNLKAEYLVALDKFKPAIDVYYNLLSNSFETKEEEYYQARIHQIASDYLEKLFGQQSWQQIVDVVDNLRIQEPAFPPYQLAQAEALINLDQMEVAQRLLEPLLEISLYRDKAQSLLSRIDLARLQQTAINLEPVGDHFLVNGVINRHNDVKLMIDTGASVSVLTQEVFDKIESWTTPAYMGDTVLSTAGGQVNAPVYQFERFQIGDFFVDQMSFVVLPMETMNGYSGLLGMNFLKHFKFEIDQQNHLLILSP